MRWGVFGILAFVLISAPAARGQGITLTFPLDGYYRPGHLMPVRIVAPPSGSTLQLNGERAITTDVWVNQTAGTVRVVPWLAYSDQPPEPQFMFAGSLLAVTQTFKPLGADDRLVAVATPSMPDQAWLDQLFPGKRVIGVHVDAADFRLGSPRSWNSADAVVVDVGRLTQPDPLVAPAQAAPIAGLEFIGRWQTSAMTIVVRGGAPGAPYFTQLPNSNDWIFRGGTVGPRGMFVPEAYDAMAGWHPGRSVAYRWQLFLRAIVFSIVVIGVVLWKPRWAPATVGAATIVFLIALGHWEATSPRTVDAHGSIFVRHPTFTDRQRWTWIYACKPGYVVHRDIVLPSPALAVKWGVSLHDGDDASSDFSVSFTDRSDTFWVRRQRELGPPIAAIPTTPTDSPVARLARSAYADAPGITVEGEMITPTNPDDTWGTVIVRSGAQP